MRNGFSASNEHLKGRDHLGDGCNGRAVLKSSLKKEDLAVRIGFSIVQNGVK
jgi:hypothetical protein